MKQFIYLFILLPIYSFGQSVEILVTDIKTNEPLPYANIYFKNSGVGESTNMEGYASFNSSKLLKNDVIVVSYIGYDNQTFDYSAENVKEVINIKLKPANQNLPEIVVTYTKPPKPKKIIKTAIKNTSKNYSNQPVIYNSLYRETIEEDGNFIQLNEAFINTYYTEYPQKRLNRRIWEDWHFDERYAFDLEGNRYFSPLLKDFNTKADQQIVVASRYSDNVSKHGIETTLIGDPLLLFAFDKIKYQYDFFNPSILRKYIFKLEEDEIINDERCYVISFYPKSADRKFRVDQAKKNKSAIYIGRIYISKASFALLRFQYKLAVERDFGFFQPRMPLDYQVEMNYKKANDIYYIDNIKFSETKSVGKKDNGEVILHQAKKELYVLDVNTDNVVPFEDSLLFKSTRFSSIRHYRDKYNADYWNEVELDNALQLDKKLIADLEIHKPLSEQFKDNATQQKENLPIPAVDKEYYAFDYHNTKVVDSLHWMALPKYENKFKRYLSTENRYAKNELVEDRKYQKKLFNQLNTFYKKKEEQERVIKPNTYFYDEDSLDNIVYYYQKDSVNQVEVLNISSFKHKHQNSRIMNILPNDANNLILVVFQKVGVIGGFAVVLPFGEMTSIDSIANVYSIEWYTDSTFLYTKANELGSARELCYHDIRNKSETVIHKENDLKFDIEVLKINNQPFCSIQSKTENEFYSIQQTETVPKVDLIKKRKKGVQLDLKAKDGIYLLVNDEDLGSSVEFCEAKKSCSPTLLAKAKKDDYIIDILPLNNKIIGLVYENSIPKLKYIERESKKWIDLKIDLGIGEYTLISTKNETNSLVFSFSSPSNPYTTYKYDFNTSELSIVYKSNSVKTKYYKYTSIKRVWAKGHDGKKIPITITKNRASSSKGLLLKVYGSYGSIGTPFFDAQDAILLEQGYTIAYAHVRGESILGLSWYKSGRTIQKRNSTLDYISCAEYLIKKRYTTSELLIGYGNSAGGLVVGQAINLKPELFNTVILDHPYLDVINTMMNDTLPLTIDHYKEIGNPNNKEVYDYMLNYSPYQNIKPQQYPNVFIIGSYQDYQTPMWQVAKYASKLRENNLSDSKIIMLTDMNSGHIGNTTGKEWIKLFAETYSFVKLMNTAN